MTRDRGRTRAPIRALIATCMFLGACTNEPSLGIVAVCNHSGRTLRFDFTPLSPPDAIPEFPIPAGTPQKPGWGIIKYDIWSMPTRRSLPGSVTGLIVRDSATGHTVHIARRELMETDVWAQGNNPNWHIRIEPDGDRFRVAETACERERWEERDLNAAPQTQDSAAH